jgi:RHS repeat-associated protein
LGAAQKYWYDANGNQTRRTIGADVFDLAYNAENQLVEVKKNNTSIATFVYDGDGKRVKSIIGAETILFVGAHYEIANGNAAKYYLAGSQRIAVRKNGTLSYLLADHLNSTSLTTDASGNVMAELRYKAWGEVRYTSGTQQTKYTYTGQYSNVNDFGLMYYGARWFDNSLGRFTQPDTLIPESQGVQAWDRYAGMNNNPIRYNDPTGHCLGPVLGAICTGIVIGVAVVGAIAWIHDMVSNIREASTVYPAQAPTASPTPTSTPNATSAALATQLASSPTSIIPSPLPTSGSGPVIRAAATATPTPIPGPQVVQGMVGGAIIDNFGQAFGGACGGVDFSPGDCPSFVPNGHPALRAGLDLYKGITAGLQLAPQILSDLQGILPTPTPKPSLFPYPGGTPSPYPRPMPIPYAAPEPQ